MFIFKNEFIFLFTYLIVLTESKSILRVHIYNYRNVDNVKHDGTKCESFHWLLDHCDPMFKICVTSIHPCDVLNKKINFWKNKKTLYTVTSQNIELDKYPKTISVKIKVDDHDDYKEPDHIAVFSSTFKSMTQDKYYRKIMDVKPRNLNVGLQASVMIRCAKGFFGPTCDETRKREALYIPCGGGKRLVKPNVITPCICNKGWTGSECNSYEAQNCSSLKCRLFCTYSEISKECTCKTDKPVKIFCRENLPTLSSTKSTISTSTISSTTTMQSTVTTKYFTSSTHRIHTEYRKNNSFPFSKITSKPQRKSYLSTKTHSFPHRSTKIQNSSINMVEPKISKSKDAQSLENKLSLQIEHGTSTIIIICLLSLLCVCVLALLFVMRKWHKKHNSKLMCSASIQRPLPPIFYENSKPNNKLHILSGTMQSSTNDSGVSTTYSKSSANALLPNKYDMENGDPYEDPIIDNMDKYTCETEYDNSDDSDMYETPIKRH